MGKDGPQKTKEQTEIKKVEAPKVVVEPPKMPPIPQKTTVAKVSEKVKIIEQQLGKGSEVAKKIDHVLPEDKKTPPSSQHAEQRATPHAPVLPSQIKQDAHSVHLPPPTSMPKLDTHKPSIPLPPPPIAPMQQMQQSKAQPVERKPSPDISSVQTVTLPQMTGPPKKALPPTPTSVRPASSTATVSKSAQAQQILQSKAPPKSGSMPKRPLPTAPSGKGPVQKQPAQKPLASPSGAGPVHQEPDQQPTPPSAPLPPPDSGKGGGGSSKAAPVPRIDPKIALLDGIKKAKLPAVELAIKAPACTADIIAAAKDFGAALPKLMDSHKDLFLPCHEFTTKSGQKVAFGKPMLVGDEARGDRLDYVIPVYITTKGVTEYVPAYLSQSQAVWRRYAGSEGGGHYYKGEGGAIAEHYQAFDESIQKALDAHVDANAPVRVMALSLENFAPRAIKPWDGASKLVMNGEQALQAQIKSPEAWDLTVEGQRPATLVDYWFSSSDSGVYGRHMNLIVRSKDGKTDYCIAATEDGMFLKYVQHADDSSVSSFGSAKSVPKISLDQDWLLTPVIEYDSQTDDVMKHQDKANRRLTFVTGSQGRERIRGMHAQSDSPLYGLNNGIAPLFSLIRAGDFKKAGEIAESMKGKDVVSPKPAKEVDIRAIKERIKERMMLLTDSYAKYSEGTATSVAEAAMPHGLRPRELLMLRRYWERRHEMPESFVGDMDTPGPVLYHVFDMASADPKDVRPEKTRINEAYTKFSDAYREFNLDPKGSSAKVEAAVGEKGLLLIKEMYEKRHFGRIQRFNVEALEWAKAQDVIKDI
jgi:hypothetical protein